MDERRAGKGFAPNGNAWVNVPRLYRPGEGRGGERRSTTARPNGSRLRNQFRAGPKFMPMSMRAALISASRDDDQELIDFV